MPIAVVAPMDDVMYAMATSCSNSKFTGLYPISRTIEKTIHILSTIITMAQSGMWLRLPLGMISFAGTLSLSFLLGIISLDFDCLNNRLVGSDIRPYAQSTF